MLRRLLGAKTAASTLLEDLKECTALRDLERGKTIHEAATRDGGISNIRVANTLINMYVKCGSLSEARKTFEELQDRSVVSWTVIILGYAEAGESEAALGLFSRMQHEAFEPDARTFTAALRACRNTDEETIKSLNTKRGEVIHLLASSCGYDSERFVAGVLVDLYGRLGRMVDAQRAFDNVQSRDVALWTALIMGYAVNGDGETALGSFSRMEREGCAPNEQTFVACLRACGTLGDKENGKLVNGHLVKVASREIGRAIHSRIPRQASNIILSNTLMDMYARCGSMEDSESVFEGMQHRTVVSWNALILGYAENGEGERALELFSRMRTEGHAPSPRTIIAALKACTDIAFRDHSAVKAGPRRRGKALQLMASAFGCDSSIFVTNTLMDMYSKCGFVEDARWIFDRMECRHVVSWNVLISGYAENGEEALVLRLYDRMKREGFVPSALTFASTLKACGLLGALEVGKSVHAEIRARHLENNVVLATCLVDFYAKCGSLDEAEQLFGACASRDLATWNALIAGYSRLGNVQAVFYHFDRLQKARLSPNSITFSCVLKACSHAGLVEKGKEYFEAMSTRFGLDPDVEHYTCIVDILGRANKLDDAMFLVRSMPVSADDVSWMTVIGACRKWKNPRLGKLAFDSLTSLDSRNPGAYVQMANIYGSQRMWKDRASVHAIRTKLGVWKTPGQSWWIDKAGLLHGFLVRDKSHSQSDQIQEKLKQLLEEMRRLGYVADVSSITRNIPELDKEGALCGHSERLAIACALINTSPGETIRIMKNLRICDDCHEVAGLVSRIEKRSIICRDPRRFHVFEDGKCSCGDFW